MIRKILLLFTVVLFFSIFNYGAIPASERAALIALYNATGGDNWSLKDGWKTAPLDTDGFAMPGTEGSWEGITVSSDHVTVIKIQGNGLKGSLPTALGNLSNLQTLNLNNNALSGSIPSQIGALTKLTGIYLLNNRLSGSIPSELGNLSNLQIFNLNMNNLSGSIPPQLGNLKKLLGLYLFSNLLSGTIPAELGNLSSLKSMDLSHNRLKGSIPAQFGNLGNLIILSMSYNYLTGIIPPQFGNLAKLEDLRMSNNLIGGSIPSQLGNLVKLYYLILSHNEIGGEVPSNLTNLKGLGGLDIGYNCLKSTNSTVRAWLNQKDTDWESHQDVCASELTITLDRTQVHFGALTTGAATAPQTVNINKSGTRTLIWEVSTETSWLTVSPTSGINSGTITISADPTGLSEGTYTGSVLVTSSSASNSPQTISVELKVSEQGTTSAPFGDFATPVEGSSTYSSVPVTGWALDDIGISSVKIYNGETYIGDALFVEGARPDVQAAFPAYPNSNKAGWGYMLLSHFLPNGGNGTYTLIAKAVDMEGNESILGSKNITIDNAHAVKPFGSIDTPTQGGIASGKSYVNYGWALTPQPNNIPVDGSTIKVYVDGVVKGHPGYNVFRSDLATLFPGYANTNGASGYFYIDTTMLENGIHSISWNVTDNAGNNDGVGSRYFTVMNSESSSGLKVKAASQLRNIEPGELYSDDSDVIHIEIKELERVEINLSDEGLFEGYLGVGDQWNRLPIGSTLDTENGVFYWQPGPGFVGAYRFVFVGKDNDGQYMKKIIVINITPR